MGRKLAREETMKLLFQMELNKDFSDNVMDLFFNENEFNDEEIKYITDAINTIRKNINKIDSKIKDNIRGWKLERLAKVDLSVLRIAVYENDYRDDIPVEVSINEAIEICKKYSTDESSKFVNGVLGNIVRTGIDK